MARTKQTARKSTGGRAPRRLSASALARLRQRTAALSSNSHIEESEYDMNDDSERETQVSTPSGINQEMESGTLRSADVGQFENQVGEPQEEHQDYLLLTPLHLRKSPMLREGRSLILPMRFGTLKVMGQKSFRKEVIPAIPDTGSLVNAITLDCLRRVGAKMKPATSADDSVLLGNGDILRVVGNATLRCSFAIGTPGVLQRKFSVFSHILPGIEVLIGRPFLTFTETMTKYCNRLKEMATPDIPPRMMNMSFAGQGLRCYLDSALTVAIADTGSDANLMRTDYAKQRGWSIEPVSPAEKQFVRLPGNKIVQLSGQVHVWFDSEGGKSVKDLAKTAKSDSQPAQAIGDAEEAFMKKHVDVLLGQLLLHSIDAFNVLQGSLVEFDMPEAKAVNLLGIKWASKFGNRCRALCDSLSTRSTASAQVYSANTATQDTSAITKFLGPVELSSLIAGEHFQLLIRKRENLEAHRRQARIENFRQTIAERLKHGTLEVRDIETFRQTFQSGEDRAKQVYEQEEQACRQCWLAWKQSLKPEHNALSTGSRDSHVDG